MALILRDIEVLFQRSGRETRGVDLRIERNCIAEIGPHIAPPPDAAVLDCRGKVVLPGLINTHHHFFQSATRCLPGALDAKLFNWLDYHYQVWRHVDSETIAAAARLAIAELLLTGCTTTSDHLYLFPKGRTEDPVEIEIQAARSMGIRFCGTRGAMTLGKNGGGLPPDDMIERDDDVLAHSEEVIGRWHDPSPFSMCQIHLAPCSPFNVTKDLMKKTAALARKHHVRLHTHLAETQDEVDFCQSTYRRRPLELMEDWEWLGDDVWFAHGIFFNDAELDKLARTRTGIAHCPSSNMRLGSGAARVPEMLARGVPLGLAVDGSASNDSSDMLGELRSALLLSRVAFGSDALTARQVISLATQGSARLLGRNELGTIEVGKAADVAIFDTEQLGYAGAHDLVAALLLCGFDRRAWAVIVNGEIVVLEGRLIRAEEEEIRRNALYRARKLWERAGIA